MGITEETIAQVEAAEEAQRRDAEAARKDSRSIEDQMRDAGVVWGSFSISHGGLMLSLHTGDAQVVTVIRPTVERAIQANLAALARLQRHVDGSGEDSL